MANSAFRKFVAGVTAAVFVLTSSAVAGPDGRYTAAEKEQLKREIARITKLTQGSCQPAEDALWALELRLARHQKTLREYVGAYEAQRKLVLDLLQPFLPTPVDPNAPKGDAAQPGNLTVIDKYNALVAESRKLKLFTEMGPMDGETPGTTVNWIEELESAYTGWKGRGGASPDTRDSRYFFEGPETLAGNVKASLGPLAQKREELRKAQGDIHQTYREELRKLTGGGRLGGVLARHQNLSADLDSARGELEKLTQQMPELVKEVEGHVAAGTFEHCYGLPAAKVKEVAGLAWVAGVAKLSKIPDLKPVPLPDLEKLPKNLPRVLLKMDGVEHYLRTKKMLAEQAQIDIDRSKWSLINVVEGGWEILYSTGVAIYSTGEFLAKAGIKVVDTVVDTAVADVQALVNLGAYGLGYEDAAFWDPTGAVARNKEWAGKLNKAIDGIAYDVGTVCAKGPPEACVAASLLLPIMKPTIQAMKVGFDAMPQAIESMDGMAAAFTTTQNKLNNAQNLSDLLQVRDDAAKIEKGAQDIRKLTGAVLGEVALGYLLLLPAAVRHLGKVDDVAQAAGETQKALKIYQEAGSKARKAVTRLEKAADKVDEIALGLRRGDIPITEARQQLAKVGETLKLNRAEFDSAAKGIPVEMREALEKTYARGLDNFRGRTQARFKDVTGESSDIDFDFFADAAKASDKPPTDLGDLSGLFKDDLGQGIPPRSRPSTGVEPVSSRGTGTGGKPPDINRPVVNDEVVDIFRRYDAQPPGKLVPPTPGETVNLSLRSLSGQYKLGGKLGSGGFKDVYTLLDGAGNDSGKVIAFLKSDNPAAFKTFMGSEAYAKSVLGQARDLPHFLPEEIARLPDGRWVAVMDNYGKQGIRVGESLVDDLRRTNLKNKILSDPALRKEADAFATSKGKRADELTPREFDDLSEQMAARQSMEQYIQEQLSLPFNKGKTREQLIQQFYPKGPFALPSEIEAFRVQKLGVASELPREAQESAFKYLIRSSRQGISQVDFKPGNIGFRQGKDGLEMIQTDLGGAYAMSDDVAREFVGDLGQGVMRERQRMQAALKQIVETGEAKSGFMAQAGARVENLPLTPGASKQTFSDNFFNALKRLSENPDADITNLVGAELNRFVREEVGRITADNPILARIGQGVEPGAFTGRRGLDAIDPLPANADEALEVSDAARQRPRVDVAKAKAAQEALQRADEQKLAKQLEEAGAKDQINTGMCNRIKSKVLGGAGVRELEDLAGRGFGCDIPNLLDLDDLEKLRKLDLKTMLHQLVPRAANDEYFAVRRAA